jgi:hypothetical protein
MSFRSELEEGSSEGLLGAGGIVSGELHLEEEVVVFRDWRRYMIAMGHVQV